MTAPTPPRARPTPEARPPRPNFSREVQRTAITQLTFGILAFAVLLLGAVYLTYLGPALQRSPGVARPILEAYLEAGRLNDPVAAHSLFSEAGIRSISREELAERFGDRSLYGEIESVLIDPESFAVSPAGTLAANEVATVSAVVTFVDQPPAQIDAELERENGQWRLRSITVARIAP